MKECYYSVLGVDKKADDDTIKKAYRQMALRNHPDKQPEEHREAATAKFQIISEAYEVLSNKQERAWYDSHRDQILRGDEDGSSGSGAYSTKNDIWRYFSTSCFNGKYDDNEGGFYRTYSELFEELARLERDDYSADSDDEQAHTYPTFGDSRTEWEDVLSFYNLWSNFASSRHFGSFDKWNIREAENRQIRRAMEAENKKARNGARREYSTAVRNLVSFVKRRDKRVIDYQAKQAAIDKENMEKKLREQIEKEEARKIARQIAREEEMKRWEEIEAQRRAEQEEDGEAVDDDESQPSSNQEEFFCVACRKSFKSEKAFVNHENSKKHRKEVDKLRKELLLIGDDIDNPSTAPAPRAEPPKKTKKNKKKNVISLDDQLDLGEKSPVTKAAPVVEFPDDESPEEPADGGKGEKKSRRRKKDSSAVPADPYACKECKENFSSKSALFRHLDSTGHHAPLARR